MRKRLAELMGSAQDDRGYAEISELHGRMNRYKAALALQHEGVPEMVTANKIPESHICFLDEIFKANDGVLNSLLKALNERTYILSLPDNDDRFNTQHNRLGLGHRDLMEHLCDKDRQYYYDHVLVPMPGVTLKNFISEVRR